ncbi:MAG: gamma-glutamyltransferase family protein [Chloroflexi bacterium]|nr:gamma-glutamyltransferase family protein [Chloroflexota bacterium]MCL5074059.1 gamma-glutamyltransferase family protein [Chloroflexota bacterium]
MSTSTNSDSSAYPHHAYCPTVRGTKVMVASGHALASLAGARILERGGNAIDAGVAAGICLAVTQPDMVSFAGVAPVMIYLAESRQVVTVDGVGVWPQRATIAYFQEQAGGVIPEGVLRTVVPAAPDAWISALSTYGTMTFAQVSEDAIRLAAEGFPVHRLLAQRVAESVETYRRWPSSAEVFLPAGRQPSEGEVFVQSDLARTLQIIADAESAKSSRGRLAGLQAARDAFYRGPIAKRIAEFFAEQGGLLTPDDMAGFQVRIEPPVKVPYKGYEVYACGPWCQGPVLLQALRILEGLEFSRLKHNSAQYIHWIVEALKLALADREAHYGDPCFVDVPLDTLLSEEYGARQRLRIKPDQVFPQLPASGLSSSYGGRISAFSHLSELDGEGAPTAPYDTSYVCVVDSAGNAFSATPSDLSADIPIVPGTGLAVSPRGSQSWLDPNHPSALAPGKRPRLTPNPAMVFREGRLYMPFGTPGGDVQCQAMCQVFLNLAEFGMSPQLAVEMPRFATLSAPNSFWPHRARPGVIALEADIPAETIAGLVERGHKVELWKRADWEAGGVCLITVDPQSGVRTAGVDPRRECFAIGW